MAGAHETVEDAVKLMVREVDRIEPNSEIHDIYTKIFENAYSNLASSVSPVIHAIHDLRGGNVDASESGSDSEGESIGESKGVNGVVIV